MSLKTKISMRWSVDLSTCGLGVLFDFDRKAIYREFIVLFIGPFRVSLVADHLWSAND